MIFWLGLCKFTTNLFRFVKSIFLKTLLLIAYRYLLAKKSHNIINLISGISVVVMVFVTMAMVVVLSVFNGIQGLVNNLYSAFDGDIHISAKRGKVFNTDTLPEAFNPWVNANGSSSFFVQDDILLKYRDNNQVATLRGVDETFIAFTKLDTCIYEGEIDFGTDEVPGILIGAGLRQQLSVPVGRNNFSPLTFNAPKKGRALRSQIATAGFIKTQANPTGAFTINLDFDNQYVISNLSFAQRALGISENEFSGIEILLDKPKKANALKKELESILGQHYSIKTKYEKNELLFKTNKAEKWVTFLILAFIMLIGGFNIIASLQMLIIEKQGDIKVLKTIGFTQNNIRKIFFFQGLLINLVGSFIGILLGLIICFLQIKFGIVTLKGGIVPYYPVEIMVSDMLLVFAAVMFVSLSSSWIPVRKIKV
jgi:lipoprotein-releasing system permease protein